MEPGKLFHPVQIEQKTETTDSMGGVTSAWAKASGGNVWARIEPLSGREFQEAQRVGSETTHKITLRPFSGLTANDRIKYGTKVYHLIEPPRDVELRGAKILCMVKEVVD